MQQRKRSLLSKIPEIKKTLEMAKYLEERKVPSYLVNDRITLIWF